MMRRALVLAGCLAWSGVVSAQTPLPSPPPGTPSGSPPSEQGRPMVRVYGPVEVAGNSQIWAMVQDSRGVIYAGAGGAVLEYDGASWRRIALSSLYGVARSMDIDDHDRIYVGAVNELGYLAPDRGGELKFVSLREKLPPSERDMEVVWRTFVTPEGVVYQSQSALYRWHDGTFTITKAASRFRRASMVDGRIYVVQPENGLNVVEHDALRPLPGTQRLVNEPFPVVARYDASRLLVGTRSDGLFLYDGTTLVPFPTDIDDLLKNGQLYRGVRLPDGTFAFSSTSAGLGIINREGRRVAMVNRAAGLPSNVVYHTMRDAEGALWLAQDVGMSRVETPSPITYFDQSDGLPGGVAAVVRHDGVLYFAMQTGIVYLDPGPASPGVQRIKPLQGSSVSQCWAFAAMPLPGRAKPALLATCNDGLYEIDGRRAIGVKTPADLSFNSYALKVSAKDPSRLWVGLRDGLTSVRYDHGHWVDEGRVDGVTEYVRSIFENPDGSLWAGTETQGVLRLRFRAPMAPLAPRPPCDIDRYGKATGLPEGGVTLVDVGHRPLFAMGTADPYVARFDDAAGRFVRETAFDVLGVDPIQTAGLVGGPDGRAYYTRGKETGVFTRLADGRWGVDRKTFARFGTLPVAVAVPDPGPIVWVQTVDLRLVRFDTSRTGMPAHKFSAIVRRVLLNERDPIFGGANTSYAPPRLPATSNALRFEFAAPDYLDESALAYESQLQGLDTTWSAWAHEGRRDYTNLGFGNYQFRVRARNVLGQVSEEAAYPS